MFKLICTFLFLFAFFGLYAHPMPNSIVLLTIHENQIKGEAQLPIGELEAALGYKLDVHADSFLKNFGEKIKNYAFQHIKARSFTQQAWQTEILDMKINEVQSLITGNYQELVIHFVLTAPNNASVREFIFDYDLIVHQVVTHKILVAVKQDWQTGQIASEKNLDIGIIELDIPSETVKPMFVRLEKGSFGLAFKNMFVLGMQHIIEGLDHLLFLLVLLLPAPLLPNKNIWANFGGTKHTFWVLFKIVTAFTIGHSMTLFLGTLKWITFPIQIVEILVAFSILFSAFHAIRPLFFGKEIFLTATFGLIHGLAFASTLSNLDLDFGKMIWSILGFNLGIEFIQLLIVLVFTPFLIFLSQKKYYVYVRIIGAILASIAAIIWIIERIGFNH